MSRTPAHRRCRWPWALAAALTLVALPAASGEPAVADSAQEARPLEVGARAPSAELRDVDGAPARLDAWVGREPVALVFYRGGW